MQRITGSVASCRFALSARPPDPDHVGVLIGVDIVRKDGASKDGWNYTTGARDEIKLFGAACERVKQGSSEALAGRVRLSQRRAVLNHVLAQYAACSLRLVTCWSRAAYALERLERDP